MKLILRSLASVLPSLAWAVVGHMPGHQYAKTTNIHESNGVKWASRGQSCGHGAGLGAVCGHDLCCSIHYGTCGSDTSCGTSNCMPLYSTGCRNQRTFFTGPNPPKNTLITQDPTASSNTGESQTNYLEHDSLEVPDTWWSQFPSLDYLAQLPRPSLGSSPYGQVITSCNIPGTLALTFDDGPWRFTSDLLDLLERERVHATFFVCGSNMAEDQLTGYGHPKLLRRMITSGHQIGSHTWAHPNMAELSWSEASRQIYLNERAMVGVLGLLPTYFRPPYLEWSAETLNVVAELGYHVITLDVDTRDWEGDYDAAKQNYLAALGWGSDSKLVLAHDIHERTVYDFAEWMIATAKDRGYSLVTVGECLGDSVDNWYRSPYTGESWQRNESLLMTDTPAHGKIIAHPGDGNMPPTIPNKGPWASENYRRPDTSNSATATRSLRMEDCTSGLLLVFAAFFVFL